LLQCQGNKAPATSGKQPLFVLGEAEAEMNRRIASESFPTHLCGSVDELVSLLSSSNVYIGNDSGPTHLAALMGLPTMAVFGPTDPAVWSPWGERVRVFGGRVREEWPAVRDIAEAVLEIV